jgi:hypothetical protein
VRLTLDEGCIGGIGGIGGMGAAGCPATPRRDVVGMPSGAGSSVLTGVGCGPAFRGPGTARRLHDASFQDTPALDGGEAQIVAVKR